MFTVRRFFSAFSMRALALLFGLLWVVAIFKMGSFRPELHQSKGQLSVEITAAPAFAVGRSDSSDQELSALSGQLRSLQRQTRQLLDMAREIKELRMKAFVSKSDMSKTVEKLQQRLTYSQQALKRMQKQKLESKAGTSPVAEQGKPSSLGVGTKHDYWLRRAEKGVWEAYYLFNGQLRNSMKAAKREKAKETMAILSAAKYRFDRHMLLLGHTMDQLRDADRAQHTRKEQLDALGRELRRRLVQLQNPQSACSRTRKILCNLNKGCGFGCQAHHVMYCLDLAYATNRTLVLESKGWRYSKTGWETVFQPLSSNCTTRRTDGQIFTWGASEDSNWKRLYFYNHTDADFDIHNSTSGFRAAAVVEVPIIDALSGRPPSLPQAIPSDLAPHLNRLHGNPFAWFAGQLLTYILRPNENMARQLRAARRTLGFRRPIVGIHVRRTDKVGTEAAYHPLKEYMKWTSQWFDRYELSNPRAPDEKRTIFLATDEARLLEEARTQYSEYQFVSDNENSRSAGLGRRYNNHGLHAVIIDIALLSECDFLVCTFSSQVCRVAYELMQTMHADASERFHSLDDVYYFGGQQALEVEAIYAHDPQPGTGELQMNVGDRMKLAGNHWDGFSKVMIYRTGQTGLVPSFKTRLVVRQANMGGERPAADLEDLVAKARLEKALEKANSVATSGSIW